MPVFSFTTSAAGESWPCLLVTSVEMPFFLLSSGTQASRGTPWVRVNASNELVVTSDDGAASIVLVDLAISGTFTFETEIYPDKLPVNFDDLSKSRFFIAVYDTSGNTGGILVSKEGLAIVSSFGSTVTPIAGSQGILPEDTVPYTLRMVVNGSTGIMDLYITKSSELATTGHVVRYTSAAPVTPAAAPDSLRIEVIGQSLDPVSVRFTELKCNCSEALTPNKRPIADTGSDISTSLGEVITLDGTESYDPEREELTYFWSLVRCPVASDYHVTGETGFTIDDGDSDGYTNVLEATGDPWSAENSPSLQPGDLLIIDLVQYVVATTDWTLGSDGTYTRDVGFDPNKLYVTTDALPDNLSAQSWEVIHQSTVFVDRTDPKPSIVPDVQGLYQFQLVVNDGVLDSLPDTAIVNITETATAYGCIPDVNFIWDFLSDAWSLFDDRDPITTIWSGMAQACSNILLSAWQWDYGKSLADIQPKFQRRWLSYNPYYEETSPDTVEITYVRGAIYSGALANPTAFSNNTLIIQNLPDDAVTVTLNGSLSPQQVADAINLAIGSSTATTKVATVHSSGGNDYVKLAGDAISISKDGTANSIMGWSSTEDTSSRLRGSNGDVDPTSIGNFKAFRRNDIGDDLSSSAVNGLLILAEKGYLIARVPGVDRLTAATDLPSSIGVSWEVSSYLLSEESDFSALRVTAGDIATFEITDGDGDTVSVDCTVLGVRDYRLGFDPWPIYERTQGSPSSYTVSFRGVRRLSEIAVDGLVDAIPRLQEIIVDPDDADILYGGMDYSVETNLEGVKGIVFEPGTWSAESPPPDKLWAEITYLSNNTNISNNFGKAVGLSEEEFNTRSDNLEYLSAVQGLWYAFFGGPSLYRMRVGTQILLGLPFAEVSGTVEEINSTYNIENIRILIREEDNPTLVRTYFIPRNTVWEADGESMIAINPATGVEYAVGDSVEQFAPLSKGVTVEDWKSDPEWWITFFNQLDVSEVEKFFHFFIQADADIIDLTNLIFAMDFVSTIKPSITKPLWSLLKRVEPDYISVTDDLGYSLNVHMVDDPAAQGVEGTGGSYRYDHVDGDGVVIWASDGPIGGKQDLDFDNRRLYPEDGVTLTMVGYHAGGAFASDWIAAFDGGGGTDVLALSGPAPTPPPPPYGPFVTLTFDGSYTAGYYSRIKALS